MVHGGESLYFPSDALGRDFPNPAQQGVPGFSLPLNMPIDMTRFDSGRLVDCLSLLFSLSLNLSVRSRFSCQTSLSFPLTYSSDAVVSVFAD